MNKQCTNLKLFILMAILSVQPLFVFSESVATTMPNDRILASLGHSFELGANETAYLEPADLLIRFVNVTEDSRCAADVQCIWAGQVTVSMEVFQDSTSSFLESFSLTLTSSDIHYLSTGSANGYVVKLIRVDPYPVATKSIQLSDYIVTLTVSTIDVHLDSLDQPFLSLASLELRTQENVPLDNQNAITAGQKILLSSTISTATGQTPSQDTVATYLVQSTDEDNVVQFIGENEFVISPISEVNIPWTPEQSGVYSIQVFVWRKTADLGKDSFIPIMEKWRIINVFASPAKFIEAPQDKLPAGIKLEIEKLGARQFYQDRDMWLPTQISVTRNDTIDWELIAWPSIGPNYVISKLGSSPEGTIVYDYYKSLGIDYEKDIQYDEFLKAADLSPFPQVSGRYFGFGWNQTDMGGAKVGPGEYGVMLLMPILIGDIGTGDDKRARILLTSAPEYFTLLAGPAPNLEHRIVLKQTVNQTKLQTGELYEHSLLLINEGNQQEYFSLISNPCPWEGAGGIVYPWYFNSPLAPGESYVITHGISEASKYPGTYYLNSSYVFAVPDEPVEGKSENDGVRVSCFEIQPNPIVLEVTAPSYEDVSLVLKSDKQEYKRNEIVHLSLYIENNSSMPFVLSEVVPDLSITTPNGTKLSLGWVADAFRPITVDPHSAFRLDNMISLDWDLNDVYQIPSYPDDGYSPAAPGRYTVDATFVSPYLRSETLTIDVTE